MRARNGGGRGVYGDLGEELVSREMHGCFSGGLDLLYPLGKSIDSVEVK
jgi:hypothetical protein